MAKSTAKTTKNNPPVVTVLGHVDHGKTTLLDYIRKAKVAQGESGGITQHIGAYQVTLDPKDPGTKITFIDTPGHEAFSKMRSRGAQVADIAILVVAAGDGVKPQTKEAIGHIKKAKIPYIVAINKVDIPGINLDVVKAQLAENDVVVEGYGGDVVAVPISATQGKGIDQLLEMISLINQMREPTQKTDEFSAIVLESYLDSHKGITTNALIRSGKVSVGDTVYCEEQQAKIRSLTLDTGDQTKTATVSQPIQILGFKEIVPTGAQIQKKGINKQVEQTLEKPDPSPSEDESQDNKLKIIVKADVAGTLEAIKANITSEIELIDAGVGDINESDVLLARSTGSRLIGFRVKIPKSVQKLAEMEQVKIETFEIIYHLLEDLQKRVLKLLEPTINEEVLGEAEIIAEFNIKGSHIAGCKVTKGKLIRSAKTRIQREEKTISEPRISAMQVNRTEVAEAKEKQEVALVFRPDPKFKIGDKVISYNIVE
jgi:translation initiation factor IF-2